MPRKITKETRKEIIRLRVAEHLSTPTIARRVKVSNHTVYKILGDKYPWTGVRMCRNWWTPDEVDRLRKLWPKAEEEEIRAAFPKRAFSSVGKKASALKIKRPLPGCRKNKRAIHPLIRQLRNAREQRGMTRSQLSEASGYHVMQFHAWEMGKRGIILRKFLDWADALGFEVVLRPKITVTKEGAGSISKPTPQQMMGRRA